MLHLSPCLLVTAIAAIYSHYFVRPIHSLIDGFRKVGKGQTDVVVKVKAKDEFRELSNSFNEMVRHLNYQQQLVKEREQENEKLLLSILPEPVAQRLKNGEESIADDFPNVTVLFANLPGFNELANSLSPNETVTLLNDLVTAFDEAAERYGVEKVKTIGSAYMAVSGLSIPRIDHTKRVIDFAIEREFDGIKEGQGVEQASLWVLNQGKVFAVNRYRQLTQQRD